DAGHWWPLRLERAATRRNDHRLTQERVAGVGGQPKAAVGVAGEALEHPPEMEGRVERLELFEELVDEPFAGDHGIARDVVDRLLRIKLGALAARLVQDVDHRRLDVEEPELKDGKEADRSGADNHDV